MRLDEAEAQVGEGAEVGLHLAEGLGADVGGVAAVERLQEGLGVEVGAFDVEERDQRLQFGADAGVVGLGGAGETDDVDERALDLGVAGQLAWGKAGRKRRARRSGSRP